MTNMAGYLDNIIVKSGGGDYTVSVGGELFVCHARGIFRYRDITPLVGDRVTFAVIDAKKKIGNIQTIEPRKNELMRPPLANIDQVIITQAATQPTFSAGLLDMFLLMAEYAEIPVLICLNKYDLSHKTAQLLAPYESSGYPVIYTSTVTGHGIETLRKAMAGKISVFAGPSGVGKSSLLNHFLPGNGVAVGESAKKPAAGNIPRAMWRFTRWAGGGGTGIVRTRRGFRGWILRIFLWRRLPGCFGSFGTLCTCANFLIVCTSRKADARSRER